jgi:hypothetical protein
LEWGDGKAPQDSLMDIPRTGQLGGNFANRPTTPAAPVPAEQSTTKKTSSQAGRFAGLAFALLLGALGYVGWTKRVELQEAYASWRGFAAAMVTADSSVTVVATTAETSPLPEEVKLVEPPPSEDGAAPKASPLPDVASGNADSDSSSLPLNHDDPAPPKALPVDDEVAALPGPQMAKIPTDAVKSGTSLVEVGRDPEADASRTTTGSLAKSESVVRPLGGPRVVGVPKEAEGGLHGLLAFLKASSWEERLKFTMLPEHVADKGRTYYESNPDGVILVDEIHYLRHAARPEVGNGLHCVFVVFSRGWGEDGFPVMVEVKGGEARVDWLTFVEFKDNMLAQFSANPSIEGKWQFHVMLRRCHYFDDDVPNVEEKDCFEIGPPMPTSSPIYAFTDRVSQLARELSTTITWDKQVTWGIVELEWKKTNGHQWVELTAVPQLNWYSALRPDGKKAPTPLPK